LLDRLPGPRWSGPKEPHDDASDLGIVYVNDEGRKAMTAQSRFPVGSIVVREKPAKDKDAKPELLAVMIKRERGFNPAGGDWLFVTTNGEMTKLKSKQKTGECLACHRTQAKTDFVYPLGQAKVGTK
jgi:Cytochrome P460